MEKSIRSTRDIGPLIKLFRTQRKLTQADLSEMTGITQQRISALESGKHMSLTSLFRILSTLNLQLTVRSRPKRKIGFAPGASE